MYLKKETQIRTIFIHAILCISICSNEIFAITVVKPKPGPGDSIKSVTVRDLIARDGTKYFRVESIYAVITHQTLTDRTTSRNFGTSDKNFMKKYLNSLPKDEAGHLVAATLGGTGNRLNLAPQDASLNRHVGESTNPHVVSTWFKEENKIRDFLKKNPKGSVEWTVTVDYGNLTTGRPNNFKYHSVYYNNGQKLPKLETVGISRNQPANVGL